MHGASRRGRPRAIALAGVRGAGLRGSAGAVSAAAGTAGPRARAGARRRCPAGRAWRRSLDTCFSALRSVIPIRSAIAGVRAALGDQLEHLALARGERRRAARRRRSASSSRETTCGSSAVPPRGDAPQRADEVVEVGHAVLQQVAEPRGVLGEHARRDAVLDVRGEDDDRDRRDGARGSRARRRRPSSVCVGGIRMSTIATSGACSRRRRAAAPSAVVGLGGDLDTRPRSSSAAIPLRTSRLSSAITTRTAAPR